MAQLYGKDSFNTDNENIIFVNKAPRKKTMCTCGHVFSERNSNKCPECGTTKKISYRGKIDREDTLILVIYYRPQVIDDNNFIITRYELVYIVDSRAQKIKRLLREHSKLNYCHQKEKAYLTINGRKEYDLDIFTMYSYTPLLEVYDHEIGEVVNCRNFYEKTGFKEFMQANKYGRWCVKDIVNYLDYYKNKGNKGIEILLKAGFEKLAMETYERKVPLKNGTKLTDFIKLPKSIMPYIKSFELVDIQYLQRCNQIHPITKEAIEWICILKNACRYLAYTKLDELLAYGYTLKELKNYIREVELYQAIPAAEALPLLSDYINMAVTAQLPYKKFPNSLKKEHDIMARNFRSIEEQAEKEKFQKVAEKYKWLEYHDDQYAILVPNTPDELVREGMELHHCVGSYTKYMADEQAMVVFLRKVDDLETPFYTIEVRDGFIVQVRGFANRGVAEESLQKFLKKWSKEKNLVYLDK